MDPNEPKLPMLWRVAGPDGPPRRAWLDDLAAELAGRGLGLALLVVAPDNPLPPPPAGVACRLALGQDGLLLRRAPGPAPSRDELLARLAPEADLVLATIDCGPGVPAIQWQAPGEAAEPLAGPDLRARVGRDGTVDGPPLFAPEDLAGLATFMLAQTPARRPHAVVMLADGRRLPAKDFVERAVAGTVRAMLGVLKGGQGAGRLELHLPSEAARPGGRRRPVGGNGFF